MVTENAVQRILQELSEYKTSLTELKNKSAEIRRAGSGERQRDQVAAQGTRPR